MKIRVIEAGRATAMLTVVLAHAVGQDFSPLMLNPIVKPYGQMAVNFFFILSGFIVPFAQHGRCVKNYVLRRFIRIYPSYWIINLGLLTYAARDHTWFSLVASFLIVPQYGPPLLPIAWTLEREMLFYVAFGLWLWNRPIGIMVFTVWAAIILSGLKFGPPAVLDPNNLLFFSGLALAAIFRLTKWPFPDMPCGPLVWLGNSAYAIYLVHLPVLLITSRIIMRVTPGIDPWVVLVVLLTVSTSAGIFFHRIVEVPVMTAIRSRLYWRVS